MRQGPLERSLRGSLVDVRAFFPVRVREEKKTAKGDTSESGQKVESRSPGEPFRQKTADYGTKGWSEEGHGVV